MLSILVVAAGVALDSAEAGAVWRVVLVALPSSVLFLGLGYLIGSLIDSGQTATNIATFTGLFFLFASGVAFPQELLSDSIKRVLDFLPTTYFGDLLFWISGGQQRHGTLLDFVILIVSAVVVVPLAIKAFRWETARN